MLPELPQFDVKSSGPRAGWAINKIFDRLDAQQLRSSDTVQVSDEQGGQRVTRRAVVAGVSSSFDLGFAVTYSPSIITVAAGKVCVPSWLGIDGEDPFPADWQVESNYSGGTISAASTAAWLEIVLTESDTDTVGPLGDEQLALNGGAGGRGAGGGGGGASRGNTGTTTVGEASGGQDGELGGAGGAGAVVFNVSDGLPTTGLTTGEGSDGGSGGAGGAGGAGTSTSFTRPTKAIASMRTWAVSSLVLHATKGTSSATSTWVKLATITGGVVSQHHLGTVHVTPPCTTYVET